MDPSAPRRRKSSPRIFPSDDRVDSSVVQKPIVEPPRMEEIEKSELDEFVYKPHKKQRISSKSANDDTVGLLRSRATKSQTHSPSSEDYIFPVDQKKMRKNFSSKILSNSLLKHEHQHSKQQTKGSASSGEISRRKKKPFTHHFGSITSSSSENTLDAYHKVDECLMFKEKGKRFKKRWLLLSNALLVGFDRPIPDGVIPCFAIPLEYSAVKPDKEKSNTFNIVTSDRTYTFQADNATNAEIWMERISSNVERLVLQNINTDDKPRYNESSMTINGANNQEIWWMASASRCADCNDTNPQWTSVNLGIFICVECSGVHRSFGTHISQVKSVRLDRWTTEQTEVMKSLGNVKSNAIWEFNAPANDKRITSHSSRDERVAFLMDKYVKRKFRKDYVPSGPKKYIGTTNDDDVKRFMTETLKEDEQFRKDMTSLLFSL